MGRAHLSFLYIKLLGANSFAVCVLRQCLKKQATAFKNVTIKIMHCHCNAMTVHIIISISFSCCYRKFSDFRRYVQAAKRQTVWLSLDCVKEKYLWALPTPTTFENVDQTFIFGTETFSFAVLCYPTENQLNHNLLIENFVRLFQIMQKVLQGITLQDFKNLLILRSVRHNSFASPCSSLPTDKHNNSSEYFITSHTYPYACKSHTHHNSEYICKQYAYAPH